MKVLFLYGIILLFFNNIYSQTLTLVDEKEVFDVDLSKAKQYKFLFANGKVIGSYIGIPIADEINKMLKDKSIDPKTTSLIISIESNNTKRYYTYFDFMGEIVPIPPYLITQQRVKYRIGDTVRYGMKGGKQSIDADISELDEQLFSLIVTNVRLQFNKMDATEQKNIFSNTSLIFPVDKSPIRWMSDVKRIRVFKIE